VGLHSLPIPRKAGWQKVREVFEVSEKISRNLIEMASLMTLNPVLISQIDYRDFPTVDFFITATDYALDFAEKNLETVKEEVKKKEEKARLISQGSSCGTASSTRTTRERCSPPMNLYLEGTFHLIGGSRPFESLVRRNMSC
jgi:benzoyl-CoA reductase/2-hydroxyglutaryl-CoA dehydratase subunit BcrC/BadD/HgdB